MRLSGRTFNGHFITKHEEKYIKGLEKVLKRPEILNLTFPILVFLPSHVVADDDGKRPSRPQRPLPSVPKMASYFQQIPKLIGGWHSRLQNTLKDLEQTMDSWP